MNNLLNLNYYVFNQEKFFNKIIFINIINTKILKEINILNYYYNLKKTLLYYNPFYGIKINSLLEIIKKKNIKNKNFYNELLLYRNNKNYIIPYKDLTYIFNLSIETLRNILKKNV